MKPMRKYLMTIALAVTFIVPAKAQIVQILNLKDGSVLNGYMKSQKPGSNCVFSSENAIIVMEGKLVKEISSDKVDYNSLTDEWKKWAEDNEVLYGIGNSREMTLSTIEKRNGDKITDVYILEKGQYVKYVEFTQRDYPLEWADITSIEYVRRSNTLLTGVNRSFTVKKSNTTYTAVGQCIKEIPGSTIYLLEEDGVVESFDMRDIIKDNSSKNNTNQTLFEQSMLLDRIVMKNGITFEGIITERNYESNNYYFILTSKNNGSESTTNIKMSDVAEYFKVPNEEYKAVYDILLRPDDLVINREEVEAVVLEESGERFLITPEMQRKYIDMNGAKSIDVVVEANFKDNKELKDYYFFRLRKVNMDKKKTDYYGFRYSDLVNSNLTPASIELSMNNTTKLVYHIMETGVYALYNTTNKTAVLIEVQ